MQGDGIFCFGEKNSGSRLLLIKFKVPPEMRSTFWLFRLKS